MTLTVTQWTNVQNALPETPDGEELWVWIEHRTFGKLWTQEVPIRISKAQQPMVDAAIEQLKAEGLFE